ncbi:hypothetical protein FOZ60_017243 [Perkinsus olseni]|uniref:Adenylate kinase n=1 Tax=Perkinsus olseni TaxID=32597 RepID=A0A7J6N163_PEROL|nr:hypothetical protein FOZ60_017243 [Perkinsus olseni]
MRVEKLQVWQVCKIRVKTSILEIPSEMTAVPESSDEPSSPEMVGGTSSSTSTSTNGSPRLDQIPTVDLLGEIRRRQAILSRPERRVVLTGPQGAGVGIATQAARLARAWGICDINHQQLVEEEEAAAAAREEQHDGDATTTGGGVPAIVEAMKAPQCRRGFVLHHIQPDNSALSMMKVEKELDHFGMSPIDTAVIIEPKEYSNTNDSDVKSSLMKRVSGRLYHKPSGRVYNVSSPGCEPKVSGEDDLTNEPLSVGKEPSLNMISTALNEWFGPIRKSVVEYFSRSGKLVVPSIDAMQSPNEVAEEVLEHVTKGPAMKQQQTQSENDNQ